MAFMRHDVELVGAYLDDLAELRSKLHQWAASAERRTAQVAAEALRSHQKAIRSELVELAAHIFANGGQLERRFQALHLPLMKSADALAGETVEDPAAFVRTVEKALAEERTLLVDDVLPMLIGTLEDAELREVERNFRNR